MLKRDILLAMREPTKAMIDNAAAPYRHDNTKQFNRIMDETIAAYWRAMIDTLIKEE